MRSRFIETLNFEIYNETNSHCAASVAALNFFFWTLNKVRFHVLFVSFCHIVTNQLKAGVTYPQSGTVYSG